MNAWLLRIQRMLLILTVAFVPLSVVATAATSNAPSPVQPIDTTVTMSDGVAIAASVYTPPGPQPAGGWPAVIFIHGWGGDRSTYNSIAPVFAQHGYVALTYDCRGFGQSGGQTTLAGPREIQDLHELMQFLIDRFHVNPDKIGATGISYGGGQSYLLAAANNAPGYHGPKVRAIAPIMGWSDLAQALVPNGVPKTSYDLGLFAGGFKPQKRNYTTDLPTWLAEGLTGVNQADFLQQLALRSVIHHPERLGNVPIFALQAWKDELFPVEQVRNLFEKLQGHNQNLKLYAGNFGHPGAGSNPNEVNFEFTQILLWFDYWLKGVNNGITDPRDRVEIGTESWPQNVRYSFPPSDLSTAATHLPPQVQAFPSWPGTKPLTYHFDPGHLLRENVSSAPELMLNNPWTGLSDDPIVQSETPGALPYGTLAGILDTVQQNSGPSALEFVTAPLAKNTEVTGQIALDLWLASNNPDAEITARVYDVAPDGSRTLVTRGVELSHGLGITVPGEVPFGLFNTHHVFPAGHRIALELSPSDSPFLLPDKKTVEIQFYHDLDHPSAVILPVLP